MSLDSIPSKTRSCSSSPPPLLPFNKSPPCPKRNSDSIDPKTRQSLSFERIGQQSSHHSSSRSRSVFSEEDPGQTLQIDPKQTFNRTRAISHPNYPTKTFIQRISIRKTNSEHSCSSSHGVSRMDRHRRKALKLLITLIVEFFVCWTPIFFYHTIGTFNKQFYRSMPTIFVDLILLFSFASASCNPLTYYFMSKRYRSVLYAYLPCCFCHKDQRIFINQKNQQARHLIKSFRSHQQSNSNEKKVNESIKNENQHQEKEPPRLRSRTTN